MDRNKAKILLIQITAESQFNQSLTKIAQVPDAPDTPDTPDFTTSVKSTPKNPAPNPSNSTTSAKSTPKNPAPYVQSSNTSVKNMQQSIKDFANEVTNYSNLDRKAFNDFITEQYLATSKIKGVEWSKDPKIITREQKKKQESDLLEMDIVVNSFKAIGRSVSEFQIDGIWGFRTNNALLNVYAFANSLVKLFTDFEEPSKVLFSSDDLKQMFNNLIKPEDGDLNKIPSAEKQKKAEVLTKLINKLSEFYKIYVKTIANKPSYRRYIDGATMFSVSNTPDIYKKTNKEINMLKDLKNNNLSIGPLVINGKPIQEVKLSDLQSKDNFISFLTRLGFTPYDIGNSDFQKKVLNEINSHIESMFGLDPLNELQDPPMDPLDGSLLKRKKEMIY